MLELLKRNPEFRKFWLAQAISQIGDRVHSLALLWIVYSLTGSGTYVGVIMIATTLPGIILSPITGTLADRHGRKWIMLVSDLVRGSLVFYLAFRQFSGTLTLTELVAATVVISISSAFFNPAALAILPNMVSRSDLTRANAMSQVCSSASAVLGPILGSGLIVSIGVSSAFLVNGVSFLISAFFLLMLKDQSGSEAVSKNGFLSDFKNGWHLARGIPLVMKLLWPVAVVNFFLSAITILIPIYAEGLYKAGSTGLGVFMSGFGAGLLISSVLLSLVKGSMRVRNYILTGFVSIGISFVVMGVLEYFYVTLLCIVVTGLMLNLLNINLITLYQKMLPDEVRGKVFGLLTALSLSLQPLAYGVMGILVDRWNPGNVMIVSGIFILLTGIYLATVRELKEIA